MTRPTIALALAFLLLGGCAASPPAHGNARGGVIQWFGTSAQAVQATAEEHCRRYGKSARITEMNSKAGGHVLFECA